MKKKENEKKRTISGKLFVGSSLIIILLLISSIPQIVRGDPPSIDSGNYVRPSDDRIAYYNFNYNDNGYVADDSGRGKSGELKGGCSFQTNERDDNIGGNAALYFDGDEDYVQIDDPDDGDFDFGNFVISSLINPETQEGDHIICSKYKDDETKNGFVFYLDGGKIGFTLWNDDTEYDIHDSDGDDLIDGEWHYVAVETLSDRYINTIYVDPTVGSYG